MPWLFYSLRLVRQTHAGWVEPEPTSTLDTSTICSSRPTTVVPTIKAGEGNNSTSDDEPKIIIGVCVSVLGLIFLLVAVGIVTKIYKEKKRKEQNPEARGNNFRM